MKRRNVVQYRSNIDICLELHKGGAVVVIVGIVLWFVGLVFVISYPINKKKNARCTEQTQGTLVGFQERYNSSGRLPSEHVYSYSVDGVEYQFKSPEYNPGAQNIGDICTIWYDPERPEIAQAFRGSAKYLKTLRNIGIALIIIGIAVMCFGCVQQFG